MVDTRITVLIDRLVDKTKRDEIHWRESVEDGEYQVDFQAYSVSLKEAGRLEGSVFLSIINDRGNVLETISDSDLASAGDDIDHANKLLELYRAARRQALSVDKALDDLLKQVS